MALSQRTTGITNSDATVVTAVSGRQTNVLSIDIINTGGAIAIVDIKDGSTTFESFEVPASGAASKEWCESNGIGRLITAGNNLTAATRTISANVEITVRFGRV